MKMESDEEEDADKLLQEEIVFLVSGLYLILVGILGAGFNIRALTKAKRADNTKLNLVLINLLVSDLSIVFIGIPLDTIGAFTKGEGLDNILCPICAFTHTVSGMSSLYSITVLTAIRCKSVLKYDNSWYIATPQRYLSSRWVQIIWGVSFMLAIPPIIGYGEFVVDVGMINCAPNWSGVDAFGLIYNWYLMAIGFFVPTTIVFISNVMVLYVSKKQTRKRSQLRRITRQNNGTARYIYNSCPVSKKDKQMHRKLALLTLSMTISFYISWTPYAINSLMIMSGYDVPHIPNVIAVLFAKSATIVNPILYIFLNKDMIRNACRRNKGRNSRSKETSKSRRIRNLWENNQ